MVRPLVVTMAFVFSAAPVVAQSSPCLLTRAEVQEAAGIAVADGKVNALNKAVCDYKPTDGAAVMNLSVVPKGPGDSADRTVAELKKRKIAAEVMPGLGDSAYASSPGYGMQQIGVYKGGNQVIVTIMLMGAPEAKAKAAAQALIKKALPKLP